MQERDDCHDLISPTQNGHGNGGRPDADLKVFQILAKMEYCYECERYFVSAEALRQHRENSARHMTHGSTSIFGSTTVTTPTPPVRASPQTSASGFAMAPGFRSWSSRPVTQTATACGTARDDTNHTIDTSKILIDSLKG
jgi:hypothetical protein